jgi:hypothetical protein
MVILIKRKLDNKYLLSAENDTWVDDVKLALAMSYKEHEDVKSELLNTYSNDDIQIITDLTRNKEISREEKKDLRNLLKNKIK